MEMGVTQIACIYVQESDGKHEIAWKGLKPNDSGEKKRKAKKTH